MMRLVRLAVVVLLVSVALSVSFVRTSRAQTGSPQNLADRAAIQNLIVAYSYWQTIRVGANNQIIVGAIGRYDDELVKRDGRWLIRSRKIMPFTN